MQVKIIVGCRALGLSKGMIADIISIDDAMGAEYSHMARVVLQFQGRRVSLWARHINRTQEAIFHLNNGNPLNRITVRRLDLPSTN